MHPKGEVWANDGIKTLNGVGGSKGDKLVEVWFKRVIDLQHMYNNKLITLLTLVNGQCSYCYLSYLCSRHFLF